MITHPPFFSSTFFALGAGDLTGDLAALAGVAFLATPPLGATAFAFGDLAGVFFAGVFFAGVLGFAGAAFEGVVRVDARVGVGAGAGAGFFAGVAFFAGVLGFAGAAFAGVERVDARVGVSVGTGAGLAGVFFAGVFAFAGDFAFVGVLEAPLEPRNLSLKSLFDRFFSFALNASSARIFAQAPVETSRSRSSSDASKKRAKRGSRRRLVADRRKKRRRDAIVRVRSLRTSRVRREGCSRNVAPRWLVGKGHTGTVLGYAGSERGVLRVRPGGGRLAGRRKCLGLLVVGLGLLRENVAAAAKGMNYVSRAKRREADALPLVRRSHGAGF